MATTAYHGLDSNSNPVDDSCYDDFYLGEMGMGAFIGDSQVFNSYYCMQFSNIGDTDNTDNTNNYAGWMVNNGRDNTYGYWFLLGPMLANPNNSQSSYTCSNGEVISGYESYTVDTPSEAYNWGQKQAQTAITAWNDSNLYNNIVRKTIFGDVEQANASGWYPSSFGVINGYEYYELNRQVIIGFIESQCQN
ncbi:hypothetical protein ACOJUR_08760 [Alicyclobacillus tolerans]|uniref:hypothetical protein n=1 Tax=Alicyclobacillus tolerans TaxID=90970 RepID=UPI003B7BA5E2